MLRRSAKIAKIQNCYDTLMLEVHTQGYAATRKDLSGFDFRLGRR
jgi:hypothetical protein